MELKLMTEPKRISVWLLLFIAILFVVMVFDISYGSDDDIRPAAASTQIDISNKSFGLGYGMGDVDLNQCMGSTQWGTILGGKQKLVLNKWCAADSLDAKGLHGAAAMLRCSIKSVSKVLGSGCIDALTVHESEVSVPMSERISDNDDDDRIEALYARLNDLEDQRAQGVEEAKKANAAVQRANQVEIQRKQRAEQAYLDYQEQFIEQN